MSFETGQRVTILRGNDYEPVEITTVVKTTHGGKRVYLAGVTTVFDEHGHAKGTGAGRDRIEPTTPAHEEAIARAELWRRFEVLSGPSWKRSDEVELLRDGISTTTLRQVVDLLERDEGRRFGHLLAHKRRIHEATHAELVAFAERVADIIYPAGDVDHPCGADELGAVANALVARGFAPGGETPA